MIIEEGYYRLKPDNTIKRNRKNCIGEARSRLAMMSVVMDMYRRPLTMSSMAVMMMGMMETH
jgi:hypothetical protein